MSNGVDNSRFEVDAEQLSLLFQELSERDQKKAYRQALKKSLNIIGKEAKHQLRRDIGRAATHKSLRYHKKLTSGVLTKVARNGKSGKVHILGDFRLKFFELGTRLRYLRGSHNFKFRGKMTPIYFFRRANDLMRDYAMTSIRQTLTESIIRTYNRRRR